MIGIIGEISQITMVSDIVRNSPVDMISFQSGGEDDKMNHE